MRDQTLCDKHIINTIIKYSPKIGNKTANICCGDDFERVLIKQYDFYENRPFSSTISFGYAQFEKYKNSRGNRRRKFGLDTLAQSVKKNIFRESVFF